MSRLFERPSRVAARALRLAAPIFVAAACGEPLAPLPSAGPPRAFVYKTEGYLIVYTTLRVAGDTVVVTRQGYDRDGRVDSEARRVPSADEWRAFWDGIRAAGVLRWPAKCGDNGERDGGGFSYQMEWVDERRAGTFINAAPLAAGGCSEDDYGAVKRFEEAVAVLAGPLRLGYERAGRGDAPAP